MVKLKKIDREGNNKDDIITFYYDNGEVLEYIIKEGIHGWFLDYPPSHANSTCLTKLGITDPNELYAQLGIYTGSGSIPYCKQEDIPVLLDYLEKNYCSESEKPKVKLSSIERQGGKVIFHFSDGETQKYKIESSVCGVYLSNLNGTNSAFARKLGILSLTKLYRQLGIFEVDGACPYCKPQNLQVLFDHLLENYGIKESIKEESIKEEKPKEQDEYSWLFG